jgi:8-oxo-dGTP pyrophosphatase MutT (NUDIX family)
MKHPWKEFLIESETKTVGVVVCLNNEQQFLLLRRSTIDSRQGSWTLPGGHIDEEDASVEAGAVRELEEETNLICVTTDLRYLGEPSSRKYYFLTQKWHRRVNISQPNPNTGEIEHDDYKWATVEEIKEIDNTEIPIYLLEKALTMAQNAK